MLTEKSFLVSRSRFNLQQKCYYLTDDPLRSSSSLSLSSFIIINRRKIRYKRPTWLHGLRLLCLLFVLVQVINCTKNKKYSYYRLVGKNSAKSLCGIHTPYLFMLVIALVYWFEAYPQLRQGSNHHQPRGFMSLALSPSSIIALVTPLR